MNIIETLKKAKKEDARHLFIVTDDMDFANEILGWLVPAAAKKAGVYEPYTRCKLYGSYKYKYARKLGKLVVEVVHVGLLAGRQLHHRNALVYNMPNGKGNVDHKRDSEVPQIVA
jgi:hypothetical protein